MVELEGLEPAEPGSKDGEIQQAGVQGHDDWSQRNWLWMDGAWTGTPGSQAAEVVGEKSNASPQWKSFANDMVGSGAYDQFVDVLFAQKMSAHLEPTQLNLAIYGADGQYAAVPFGTRRKMWDEANAEALPALKQLWAMDMSGTDPSTFNYMFNPLARANYLSARALAVSSDAEGWGLMSEVALSVATAWYANVKLTNQTIAIHSYPRAGGGGLSMGVNGDRTVGLDYHRMRIGGGKTGKDMMLPHIDLNQLGIKHFPWKQLDKYKRGLYR